MIKTNRFTLKPLTQYDVNDLYLSWLTKNNANGYIKYAKNKLNLKDLKQYVKDRENKGDILFLGIFTKDSNQHIGNIKYEPIDYANKTATMGILIGDKNWRGKGVASEVITASSYWLKDNKDIKIILLGVDKNNIPALSAYQKNGFKISKQQDDNIKMTWYL